MPEQPQTSRTDSWKHTKASNNQHLVQLLEDSLKKEDRRLARLMAASNPSQKKRLEMYFNVERDRERKLFELVKHDHDAALRIKVRASASCISNPMTADSSKLSSTKKMRSSSLRGDTNQAGSHERVPTSHCPIKQERALPQRARLKPLPASTLTSRERASTPAQDEAFRAYVAQKLESAPKRKPHTPKGLLTADKIHENTSRLSTETLLHEKCHLLKKLHQIVVHQQRMLEDDQVTVRSSVSSFQSLPSNTTVDCTYVPFTSTT
ncbi:hypothetical protein H310_11518 [Aphanomyces invadans]|uniref:Uncharacterized protein n=1 Tax=Aphanomyces invadans TaxID=157072 RepID=A0A024TLI8_9STRA|nr:hypothetical protein H310_11518 [Aphanomyces invadans]ETV94854.1 hypothetical protein H310_11518 [Aphanomyces invadans]|eukprot:XP_008876445.1 hypothetical protein H310_11518 [Aphanomyces invadans]